MRIEEHLPKIQKNISLAKYTTFKIGGPARYFFVAKNKEDLIRAIKTAKKLKLRFSNSRLNIHTLANQGSAERRDSGARQVLILGGGSNVLFSDRGFNGLVINFQFSIFNFQKDGTIYAGAGTKLEDIVKLATKESLTGLEWAAGIPGTVGGAVYGNAGAFNSVTGDIVKSVEILDFKTLKIKNFSKKDCKFFPKNTIFKNRKNLIILSVVFKLKKGNKKQVQKKIKEYLSYRKKSHPFNLSSAGCAFKNYKLKIKNKKLLKEFPELKEFNKMGMVPASYLVEKSGLKGKKIGGAQISTKHANFIVNLEKAKAKDVIKLIKLAKQKVKKKFGVNLEEEVQIIN